MGRKGGNGGVVAFLFFSDANERTNGFPAFSLQSVSPLQHAPLPGHCGRTKLPARDPITWNFSREAGIVYREAEGGAEWRKGRETWRATRALATSFLFPPLLLSLHLPFFAPTVLQNPPTLRPSVLLFTAPLWVGKPKTETGAKHNCMLEPSEPWAGAADKRSLCPLRKWLSQDPPSPPHTGESGLRVHVSLICTFSSGVH